MARAQIEYSDLTGGLNNVNSVETLNANPTRTESPDICNIEYFKLGGIKSMDGNIQIGDKQTSKIVGGAEYVKEGKKYLIIATYNGEVKIYNPATEVFDLVYTFHNKSNLVSFCNMNNGIVATNGIDDLVFYEKNRHKLLSGTVSSTIDSPNITGTSTKFKTELKPGDTVKIDNNVYYVKEITDDTHLILRVNSLTTSTDVNLFLGDISECNATLINEEDANIATPIRGTAIQYYNGRLWVGTSNGLFYSQIGLYNGWDIKYDAGVLYSVYNDTSEIKALGLYSNYMLVHKELYTYILTCTGVSSTIEIQPYTNISCGSQYSYINSNAKYYVYSKQNMGIYPLTQITVFSDKYVGEEISKKVKDLFTNIRQDETDKIYAVSLPRKRWIIFYLPLTDKVGSGYGLIFDFQTKSWLVRNVPQEINIAFNYNNNIYLGTEDGLLLKEFVGNTFNGSPINAYYKSPWFDWAGGYMQSFSEFEITLSEEFRNEFYIRTFKDGDSVHEDRIVTSENPLDVALVWEGLVDDDNNIATWDNYSWVSSNFSPKRMMLPNNVFSKFQLEIGCNKLGQSFAIYGYSFRRVEMEEAPW